MSALVVLANKPEVMKPVVVSALTVLPSPSKRPPKELPALMLADASLPIGLKLLIEDRLMLAPSA